MEQQKQDLVARLRAIGYRLTAQREALLDVIWNLDGHFTVEMVRDALPDCARADTSTIYRTLELLVELGAVHVLTGISPTEYELVREPHHHLHCTACGTVAALSDDAFDLLVNHLFEAHGFAADFTHLAIPGRCRHCQNHADAEGA